MRLDLRQAKAGSLLLRLFRTTKRIFDLEDKEGVAKLFIFTKDFPPC